MRILTLETPLPGCDLWCGSHGVESYCDGLTIISTHAVVLSMQAATGWSRYEGEGDEQLEGHVFAPVSGVDLIACLYYITMGWYRKL